MVNCFIKRIQSVGRIPCLGVVFQGPLPVGGLGEMQGQQGRQLIQLLWEDGFERQYCDAEIAE